MFKYESSLQSRRFYSFYFFITFYFSLEFTFILLLFHLPTPPYSTGYVTLTMHTTAYNVLTTYCKLVRSTHFTIKTLSSAVSTAYIVTATLYVAVTIYAPNI